MEVTNDAEQELLVFNLTPRLKVAGIFHGLNERDKSILDHLIKESDFVALECLGIELTLIDKASAREMDPESGNIHLKPSFFKRGFDPKLPIYYLGHFDALYFCLLAEYTSAGIDHINSARGSDSRENEFLYCQDVAQNLHKDVYYVDVPPLKLVFSLISIPFRSKLHDLAYMIADGLTGNGEKYISQCKAVRKVLEQDREEYMVGTIEQREGTTIRSLERNGLLVVGKTHAENYQKLVATLS